MTKVQSYNNGDITNIPRVSGTYSIGENVTGMPFSGGCLAQVASDGYSVAITVWFGNIQYIRVGSGDVWGVWNIHATATPPQQFNLPLASQIDSVQQYVNIYYKTQDNIVHVSFCILRSDKFANGEVFSTLPVGYRPGHTIARSVGGDGIDFGNGIVVAEIQVDSNGNIMLFHCNNDIKWLFGEFSFIAEN